MRPGWLFFAVVALGVVLGSADLALAWGPSAHLWIGERILTAFTGTLPVLAALLAQNARPFLYGTVAPDFFVGKGSRGHATHCHNWAAGQALLDAARTDAERAFAMGYFTHLAADVVGHNHFVPNQLYRSPGSAKLGHVYWELHADNLLDRGYARLGAELGRGRIEEADRLLRHTLGSRGLVPLAARRQLFTTYLRVHGSTSAERLLERMRGYAAGRLRNGYDLDGQLELSLAHAVAALEDPSVPILSRYDPIGEENLEAAKRLRKAARSAGTFSREDAPFAIEPELLGLVDRLARAEGGREAASVRACPAPTILIARG